MDKLPTELRVSLASHLDIDDASRLNRTNKSWQEALIPVVWKDLSIFDYAERVGARSGYIWDGKKVSSPTSMLTKKPTIILLGPEILNLLHNDPAKRGAVRNLSLATRGNDHWLCLAVLVEFTAPNLEKLKLECFDAAMPEIDSFGARIQGLHLTKLVECHLSMLDCASFKQFWNLIVAAPLLTKLAIRFRSIDDDNDLKRSLPSLRELSLGISPAGLWLAKKLLTCAPNLSDLTLSVTDNSGRLAQGDIDAILSSKQLYTLRFNCNDGLYAARVAPRICEHDAPNVKELVLFGAQDAHVYHSRFPNWPTLETVVWTGDELDKVEAYDFAEFTNDFVRRRARDFARVPTLKRILFSVAGKSRHLLHWRGRPMDGVIVRSYHHTTAFYHLRYTGISPDDLVKDPEGAVQARIVPDAWNRWHSARSWHECFMLGDTPVPRDLAERVYRLAGLDMEWDQPERDLDLPSEAWTILEQVQGVQET